MGGWQQRQDRFWISITKLLGHLVASTLVFVTLFTLGWGVSWYLSSLERMHAFDPQTSLFAGHLEHGLLYVDATLSGAVLVTGVLRFIRDLWER